MHEPKRVMMMVVASALWLSGCAGNGPSSQQAEAAKTDKSAVAAGINPKDAEKGKIVFAENCEVCHQEGGQGKPGVAPSLTNKELLSAASDRFLSETIRDGRPPTPMPSFAEILKPEDIRNVISYLRSYARGPVMGDKVDEDRQAMGDPRLGKRWFTQVCSGCHGPNGEGYEGAGSGTAIGKSGFLSKASDGFIRYIVKNGRSNTPMRGFSGANGLANLNDQEIDDIIAYLRIVQR